MHFNTPRYKKEILSSYIVNYTTSLHKTPLHNHTSTECGELHSTGAFGLAAKYGSDRDTVGTEFLQPGEGHGVSHGHHCRPRVLFLTPSARHSHQ